MSTLHTFNLPDVGEGLTEAEIVSWRVRLGDVVAVNDVLVEIETAKSLVELPSPYAGLVAQLLVAEGDTVAVGTPIIAIGAETPAPVLAEGIAPAHPDTPGLAAQKMGIQVRPSADADTDTGEPAAKPLVGSGPKADAVTRRARRGAPTAAAAPAPVPPSSASVASVSTAPAAADLRGRALAKPPVRKKAKDLGIDLADVSATGLRGEVTARDLLSYQEQRAAEQDGAGTFWAPATVAGDARVERIKVKGVRKATAKAMVESAFSAPHVSIFVDVDASRTMEFVKRLKASRDFEGIKVSPLLILAKAVIWAAARNPSVNATWTGEEIIVKHYMNLGIAAATPRGLMVPNIKDAQDLSLKELAIALNSLATTARAGKTQPADMAGGSLTITNIGALGIDTGTPIINPGEVAIVAFGTIKQKPWVLDGEVIPRWITTLGGSFDHRVVDGDLSARFMADVAAILEEPALLLD
ncbi:dihydrolipoamide acetyltransferase family protein [Specibacter cremeus]|uniref:dihydrolipoamide acetyltransferase family protein n=1 Tax=Specibacter cremeus TaxID=1629051 RepID=UPI000F77416F|nr:dihydrolipoamide acetyltransferase family protein [Specibacter cremeus]